MYKSYLVALALFAALAIAVLAFPAHAHGNKKHPAATTQTASPAIKSAVVTPPANTHNDDHHDGEADHNAPHEHASPEANHGEGEAQAHEHGAGEEEEEGHSHWGANGPSTPFEKFLAYLGNFHALVVHFPIALFLTAALAQILYLKGRKESYASIVRFTVWIGAFGALGAGLLGWAHAGPVPASESSLMMSHRWMGTLLLFGGIITAFFMEAARRRSSSTQWALVFNIALFGMAILVATNGFLGGALAHGGLKHLLPGMMG